MKIFAWIAGILLSVALAAAIVGFFFLGFYLSPQDKLSKSGVIVAISGGNTEARTQEAVYLYKKLWAPKIVFSGAAADPNSPSNARAMATEAERLGVPAGDIILDETSTTTRENATNVAAIAKNRGLVSVILVTSPYHQRRAYIAFRRALPGTIIINHSSVDNSWRRSQWWATSTSRAQTFSELQKVIFELVSGQSS